MCTVRMRAHSSLLLEETMAEKKCAHPLCTCVAEPGKEFCSDECRSARREGSACACTHPGCQSK
jgi:hypothetical protein